MINKFFINKNLFYLLIGNLTSKIGTRVYTIALSVWLTFSTGDAKAVSLVLSASTIATIIINPIAGIIVDRFNKKNILIVTDIICGIVSLVMAFFCYSDTINLPIITILSFLLSATSSMNRPASKSIVSRLVGHNELVKANSLNTTFSETSGIIGPVFSSLLLLLNNGMFLSLAINGFTFILSALFEVLIKYTNEDEVKNDYKDESYIKSFISGLLYVFKQKEIFILIMFSSLINIFCAAMTVLLPYYATNVLNASKSVYSNFILYQSIGAIIISIWLIYRNIEVNKILNLYWIIMIFGFSLIIFNKFVYIPVLYVMMIIVGMSQAIFNTVFFSYVQKYSIKEYLGRTFSIIYTFALVASPISYLLFGYFADKILNISFYILGIGIILVSVLFYIWHRTYLSLVSKHVDFIR